MPGEFKSIVLDVLSVIGLVTASLITFSALGPGVGFAVGGGLSAKMMENKKSEPKKPGK